MEKKYIQDKEGAQILPITHISAVRDDAGNTLDSILTNNEQALLNESNRAKAAENDRYTKSETYNKTELNNLITTPNQQYVTATATDQTTSVTDVLPATGSADTTYRVGNWDGTQYNDSVFSEYAWNGSAYVKLSTKSQVGEVYDISANHAGTTYADLAAALGTNGANIPQSLRKGGMSVKFVQGSDNKYVQARCMAQNFTTDITQWQSVDDEPTAGSDNLVKSGGVAEELQKIFEDCDLKIFQNIEIGKTFSDSGYSDYVKNATCKLTLNGTYSIPTMSEGYMYNIYKYISDNEGELVVGGWQDSALTKELIGTYVFVFRHIIGSTVYNWNSDDSAVINNVVVSVSNYSTLEGRINILEDNYADISSEVNNLKETVGENTNISINIPSGDNLSSYYNNVEVGKSYSIKFLSSDNPTELSFIQVWAYNVTTNIEKLADIPLGKSKVITIPTTANRILFYAPDDVTSNTSIVIQKATEDTLIFDVNRLTEDVDTLNEEIFPEKNNVVFCNDISPDVLVEMYFPNITSDWKLLGVRATGDLFRLNLKDAQGNDHFYGEGSTTYGLDGEYSDLIHTWIDETTCNVIGYFILHYTGSSYSQTDDNGYTINIDKATNIDCSPRIKKYLSRQENLVLLGDSLFGKGEFNILSALLRSATNKKVFNGSMGGMRMSTRGNTNDDALSYVGITDAIFANDWSDVQAAAIASGGATNPYQKRLAELKLIDWSLPTTVICCYCNNDITGNVAIGDTWVYTAQKSDFVKNTLLGAMNYGIYNLLGKYPLVRLVHLNLAWRYKTDKDGNSVPPYVYKNINNVGDAEYNDAIKENASRLGISVFDYSAYGGRNEFNKGTDGVVFDGTHYNINGYEMLSKMLSAIDNGWLM